jgi:hypothetical protein
MSPTIIGHSLFCNPIIGWAPVGPLLKALPREESLLIPREDPDCQIVIVEQSDGGNENAEQLIVLKFPLSLLPLSILFVGVCPSSILIRTEDSGSRIPTPPICLGCLASWVVMMLVGSTQRVLEVGKQRADLFVAEGREETSTSSRCRQTCWLSWSVCFLRLGIKFQVLPVLDAGVQDGSLLEADDR